MICEASNLYIGVTVTQEYFYFMEQPAGFLKAQGTNQHDTVQHAKRKVDQAIRLWDDRLYYFQ